MIMEDFIQAPPYGGAGAVGQIIGGEKFLLENFGIRCRCLPALPIAYDKKRHVITGKSLEIGKQAMKPGVLTDLDTGFFAYFAAQAGEDRFIFFNAAAWKMPSGSVTMTNEEDRIAGVKDNALGPQGLTTGQPPEGLQ